MAYYPPLTPLHSLHFHHSFYPNSLPLQDDTDPHRNQQNSLQPGILAQQDSHVADVRNIADDAADDVGRAGEMGLAAGVEFGVVGSVVVAFCEEFEGFVSVVMMLVSFFLVL